MEDVFEPVLLEQAIDQVNIVDAAFHECGVGMHVVGEASGEVIEGNHVISGRDEVVGHMGADEFGRAGDKNLEFAGIGGSSGVSPIYGRWKAGFRSTAVGFADAPVECGRASSASTKAIFSQA